MPAFFAALNGLARANCDRIILCLLLDGCSDDSSDIASLCASDFAHEVVCEQAALGPSNAGRARGRALDMGLQALGGEVGLLLTTDADSLPASNWVSTMREALRQADVVAGRIIRVGERDSPLHDRLESYLDALFAFRRQVDPVVWEAPLTHHHAGGANLGMRTAALRQLGGIQPLEAGEDARLIDDAARAGLHVRRDATCLVHTSDRRLGRASAGLATTLDWLDYAQAGEVRVAHPDDASWQYRMQALARSAYDDNRLDTIAAELVLTWDHARGVARDSPNAEAFAMRIVPSPPGGMRQIGLPEAEIILSALAARHAA